MNSKSVKKIRQGLKRIETKSRKDLVLAVVEFASWPLRHRIRVAWKILRGGRKGKLEVDA